MSPAKPRDTTPFPPVRRFWPRCLALLGVVIAVALIAGSIYLYSGWYNFAATEPHWNITENIIRTVVRASVQNQADRLSTEPPTMPGRADTLVGFAAYDAMCADCHGAPGIGRSEFGQGLYPRGPSLLDRDTLWTDHQLFWIVRHGLKMTGMPAFGPTHNDSTLWRIVAFTKHLSEMSYYDYVAMQDSLSHDRQHEH